MKYILIPILILIGFILAILIDLIRFIVLLLWKFKIPEYPFYFTSSKYNDTNYGGKKFKLFNKNESVIYHYTQL